MSEPPRIPELNAERENTSSTRGSLERRDATGGAARPDDGDVQAQRHQVAELDEAVMRKEDQVDPKGATKTGSARRDIDGSNDRRVDQ